MVAIYTTVVYCVNCHGGTETEIGKSLLVLRTFAMAKNVSERPGTRNQ